jgi:hypothetical protein
MRTLFLGILFLITTATSDTVLLKARYKPAAGTDIEYGQGAIERTEVYHHPVEPTVWLILVDSPGDPAEWQRNLNAVVDPQHGSFTVECATPEEEAAVREGRVAMQR